MTAFQHWVIQQKTTVKNNAIYPTVVGIRTVVSNSKQTIPVSRIQNEVANGLTKDSPDVFSTDLFEAKPAQLIDQVLPQTSQLIQPVVPSLVVYDDSIVLQFPKALASMQNMRTAIARVLLSPTPLKSLDLLDDAKFNTQEKPYYFAQIRNEKGESIRYPKQAFDYAKVLITQQLNDQSAASHSAITLKIPKKTNYLNKPAKNYQAWVETYAKDFKVDPSLVYAIMEVESAFKPDAVSKSNAIGLMQIKASAAGRDVFKNIDFVEGEPSEQELLQPHTNVRIGTAYLGLLKHDYLSAVKNAESRELLAISSYNGGLSTVLKLFGANPEKALAKINRLKPTEIYRKLREEHESDETREYIEKVVSAKKRYLGVFS